MPPVLPLSNSSCFACPGNVFIRRKECFERKCSIMRKSGKQIASAQRYSIPLSTSAIFFLPFRIECAPQSRLRTRRVTATGTDVVVEEAGSAADHKESDDLPESVPVPAEASEDSTLKSDPSPARSKRPRSVRTSDMPPLKNEDLVPGAIFTGKVRSIQPFGAFVDFGAFTDGLVHISRLSDGFVKDVNDVVSIGQEVSVRLVEANTETGRISLTMRSSDEPSKSEQKESTSGSERSRSPRKSTPSYNQKRNEPRKSSKFVRGQELEGTVKNLTRSGAFISLPEGEEGFLPKTEEAAEGFGNMLGETSLQVGQEVKVRVLRFNRGQVTLTMKSEVDTESDTIVTQSAVHTATNPFVLAFRRNKDISAFLDQQQQEKKPTSEVVEDAEAENDENNKVENSEIIGVHEGQEGIIPDASLAIDGIEDEQEAIPKKLAPEASSSVLDDITEVTPIADKSGNVEDPDLSPEISSGTLLSETMINEEATQPVIDDVKVDDGVQSQASVVTEELEPEQDTNASVASSSEQLEVVSNAESMAKGDEQEASPKKLAPEASLSVLDDITEVTPVADKSGNVEDPDLSPEISSGTLLSENMIKEEATQPVIDDVKVDDGAQSQASVVTEELEPEQDTNASVASSREQWEVASNAESMAKESDVGEEVPKNEVDVQEPVQESLEVENSTLDVEVQEGGPELGNVASISSSLEQNDVPEAGEGTSKASISPAVVKQLREESGAGMMDCKKALLETGGDIIKAQEYLRKKGLASADKKASRTTAEGRIGAYIHDSRIGVLVEVNCETDFVARGDIFKELVEDLAMQVAACPQVQYIDVDEVPHDIVDKEREIEMQKEDLLSKPEQIRSKIVDGRISKRLQELALLEQPYIKNDKTVVKDWVKQTIATIGENIKVKRFARYNLGEGLEKRSQDFAAEVAAQTTAKPPAPAKEQSAVGEVSATVEEPPKAAISATLVKQLREETGAGMMDCKKALSETGGDLEKAQEYLRKKGLSSADKKSSRLAAEGRIGSYIHDSRIGVLIEVNCETDFVGRSEKFKNLVDDLAMQVVACPQVQCVSLEDIPTEIINREKELEMQREDLQSKPENIREKIVEGRVSKRLGELALLEQPFIKDDTILVKDLVKQSVAAIGENIKVRRFVRFTLGEETGSKKDEA